MKTAVIIFVRNPEKGKVKTRLAATIGDDAALYMYHKLLQHTLSVSREVAADTFVFYAGSIPEQDIWSAAQYHRLMQAEGDLGLKMETAFSEVLNKGFTHVIIIGSDCPELTAAHLEAAFAGLQANDVVIGPALDGGYYLLGMKQLHPQLFDNKSWSTDAVFAETINTCNELGLSVASLEVLTDVDEAKDLPPSWQEEWNNLPHLA